LVAIMSCITVIIYQCPLLHHYNVFKTPRLDSAKAFAREIT